jgi:hypothetical protein
MVLPLIAAGLGAVSAVIRGINAASQVREAGRQAVLASKHQARSYIRQAKYAARDIRRTAEVQAKNYLTQAKIHERQATLVREKGAYDAARMTEKGRAIIGGQVAAFASSGIAVEGTIADVVRSTGESVAMDIAAHRLGTRIGWENERILAKINRKNAKDTLKYGEVAAKDALRFGREAAKDALKFGAAAGASAQRATPIAFISPVIEGAGNFISTSGIFDRGAP